jgi:hypothetical protein
MSLTPTRICKRHWDLRKKLHGKRLLQKDIALEVGGNRQVQTYHPPTRHIQEWEASGIDPEITTLNMVSLNGNNALLSL